MKKILLLSLILFCNLLMYAQDFKIELWGENSPVVFSSHTESDGGSYGKMISDQQLDFWEEEKGIIAMRQTYDVTYSKGYPRSGSYIYRGRLIGNKLVFETYQEEDDMGEPETPIDKSYMNYEAQITGPNTIVWGGCTYTKMTYDYTTNKWIPVK